LDRTLRFVKVINQEETRNKLLGDNNVTTTGLETPGKGQDQSRI
jgi:hypothetical protein